jgi:hypothetical protein
MPYMDFQVNAPKKYARTTYHLTPIMVLIAPTNKIKQEYNVSHATQVNIYLKMLHIHHVYHV